LPVLSITSKSGREWRRSCTMPDKEEEEEEEA
jgi:hypothetical protein